MGRSSSTGGEFTTVETRITAMNEAHAVRSPVESTSHARLLFWGCFVALVTTSFAFMSRVLLIGTWGDEFGLDEPQKGRLTGIGIWPFAVSIILFSLVIDHIGYKTAMVCAFLGHLVWTAMAVAAWYMGQSDRNLAFQLLYWGSLVCALANGTVEAFINPLVATMFSREKTKWLNILHAGWPAGLVLMGMLFIGLDRFAPNAPWAIKVGLIGVPGLAYFAMLIGLKFPQSERVTAGVSYREMLQEFGIGGAVIVAALVVLQLMDFFSNGNTRPLSEIEKWTFIGIGVVMVVAFGAYTRTFGRGLLLLLVLVMMPLATTEIGTDGWIADIMAGVTKAGSEGGYHSAWILVYTSAIMLVLRFFAGPIVHALSPLGLLAASSVLAAAGLGYLSTAGGLAIIGAATLYGIGKTFFWPTMLGVVSEQFPKGGALTLNAISGIGMLAVGTLGMTFIGALRADREIVAVAASDAAREVPGLVSEGRLATVEEKRIYEVIGYRTIDEQRLESQLADRPEAEKAVKKVRDRSAQGTLRDMMVFPLAMFVAYAGLIIYFRARGGYKAELLAAPGVAPPDDETDEKYTGGVLRLPD
ncbi:MAG: MFS transporter [Planctomycetaceae bacterium]